MPHQDVALSAAQIEQFVHDGFVRIDGAFPRELADACRRMLWLATGCAEDAPSTWTRPVMRIGEIPNPLFREAANTPRLHAAYDALVGPGRWLPRGSLGTFAIRFPSPDDPGDCGWHIDVSFGTDGEPDFLKWRANVSSKGRALLMLFLFSDVGDDDAPTRLRVGSHFDIARRLEPHGAEGLTLGELASTDFAESSHRPEARRDGTGWHGVPVSPVPRSRRRSPSCVATGLGSSRNLRCCRENRSTRGATTPLRSSVRFGWRSPLADSGTPRPRGRGAISRVAMLGRATFEQTGERGRRCRARRPRHPRIVRSKTETTGRQGEWITSNKYKEENGRWPGAPQTLRLNPDRVNPNDLIRISEFLPLAPSVVS